MEALSKSHCLTFDGSCTVLSPLIWGLRNSNLQFCLPGDSLRWKNQCSFMCRLEILRMILTGKFCAYWTATCKSKLTGIQCWLSAASGKGEESHLIKFTKLASTSQLILGTSSRLMQNLSAPQKTTTLIEWCHTLQMKTFLWSRYPPKEPINLF